MTVRNTTDFCGALKALKEGQRVRRLAWDDWRRDVELHHADDTFHPATSFFILNLRDGGTSVEYELLHSDVLSDDWIVI